MALDQNLLDILVCPQCKGALALIEGGMNLLCERCKLKYPVRDGIPIMVVEEAYDLRQQRKEGGAGAPAAQRLPRVTFRVTSGVDEGMSFHLEQGTCRAVGRATQDPNKTTVFNVDFALSLDESTKGLILQYVGKQFRKSSSIEGVATQENFGGFRRSPDVVLADGSLSRLHAMIFYDVAGVGILDLVSKNGTFVNGQEVESRLLQKGDTIEVGETTILFEGE